MSKLWHFLKTLFETLTGFDETVPEPDVNDCKTAVRALANEQPSVRLFDVEADPSERFDVTKYFPYVVDALLGKIAAYNWTAVPVTFPPCDPQSDPQLHGGVWTPWQWCVCKKSQLYTYILGTNTCFVHDFFRFSLFSTNRMSFLRCFLGGLVSVSRQRCKVFLVTLMSLMFSHRLVKLFYIVRNSSSIHELIWTR